MDIYSVPTSSRRICRARTQFLIFIVSLFFINLSASSMETDPRRGKALAAVDARWNETREAFLQATSGAWNVENVVCSYMPRGESVHGLSLGDSARRRDVKTSSEGTLDVRVGQGSR